MTRKWHPPTEPHEQWSLEAFAAVPVGGVVQVLVDGRSFRLSKTSYRDNGRWHLHSRGQVTSDWLIHYPATHQTPREIDQ